MNFHPLSVHFPIALLIVSWACYVVGFIKKQDFPFKVGSLLHSLGLIGIVLAIISGKIDSSGLTDMPHIQTLLRRHELMAYGSIWSFGMLWLWKYVRHKALIDKLPSWEKWIYAIIFLLALVFMGYSSHLGGTMVYEFGVNVQSVP
ncbi:MAG: DUF2231 domain-containing protein [Bacteroidota bacterium]